MVGSSSKPGRPIFRSPPGVPPVQGNGFKLRERPHSCGGKMTGAAWRTPPPEPHFTSACPGNKQVHLRSRLSSASCLTPLCYILTSPNLVSTSMDFPMLEVPSAALPHIEGSLRGRCLLPSVEALNARVTCGFAQRSLLSGPSHMSLKECMLPLVPLPTFQHP